MRFYRIPNGSRIPDKTKAKAKLAAAMANYRGEITLCAPAVAAAPPGVSAQERGKMRSGSGSPRSASIDIGRARQPGDTAEARRHTRRSGLVSARTRHEADAGRGPQAPGRLARSADSTRL